MQRNRNIGPEVAVVGGGAAGLMAAISAARQGASATILEKNPRVGKKILATGNGRCNFTNLEADSSCYMEAASFAAPALAAFPSARALAFFGELGIAHKVEEAGKVFPLSEQASSILDVLLYELQRLGVTIAVNTKVERIVPEAGGFTLFAAGGGSYRADKVILAAGGKAMPQSGSDGDSFLLAEQLGHRVTPLFPALVQLMLEGAFFKQLDGVKFPGTAELLLSGKVLARDSGDILFANYGVSGPPVFQLSRPAGALLQQGQKPILRLSLLPHMNEKQAQTMLTERFAASGDKDAAFALVGLVNKRIIPVVLHVAGITDIRRPAAGLTQKEINALAGVLTGWEFAVRGTKGWQSAQVTAGGVDRREVEATTLQSKKVPGLYFAGEVLDVDGLCGGFNLQWAWSSGFVAGSHAAGVPLAHEGGAVL